MAYKTILVHLADDPDRQDRLTTAVALAKSCGAHLVALFVTKPLGLAPEVTGRGASIPYLDQQMERTREVAVALESEFRAICERDGLTFSWIVEDGEHIDRLAHHAHAADLIVVGRGAHRHAEDRVRLRLGEELVFVSGLPVLSLPEGFRRATVGRRVLFAWKATREAVRTLRDALPLLQSAEAVLLATVAEEAQDALSHLEVHQHLLRHGVPVETLALERLADGVGPTLLAAAESHRCDLIALGAYSHARWREVVFGGVTRALYRQSKLPLLMSH